MSGESSINKRGRVIEFEENSENEIGAAPTISYREETEEIEETEETPLLYIFSFYHRKCFRLKNNMVVGQGENKNRAEESRTNSVYGNIIFEGGLFKLVTLQSSAKILFNKSELRPMEEKWLELGDSIEINGYQHTIVDLPSLTRDEAKAYIGKRLLQKTSKQSEELFERVVKEVQKLHNELQKKEGLLLQVTNKSKRLILLKKEIADLEAENLEEKVTRLTKETAMLQEEYKKKLKIKEDLGNKLSDQKERKNRAIMEEKQEIENKINELKQKQKMLSKVSNESED